MIVLKFNNISQTEKFKNNTQLKTNMKKVRNYEKCKNEQIQVHVYTSVL
jgi:hypothetical protein